MTTQKNQQNKRVGDRRLIGHEHVREQMWRIVQEDRISHAYLISGSPGTGKKALALAFAESINGIEHLGGLDEKNSSKRRSWYYHPDIHVFIPLPGSVGMNELSARLELLSVDPYEIVDFSSRPTLTEQESSKNRRAFYSVDYFNSVIRRAASFKPSEGKKNIIIITNIETMRKEVMNSFLKLLEEPGENVMFILTADNLHYLLPTIISRCQILTCRPLEADQIYRGLLDYDGVPEEQARFLSQIAGGNYSYTRLYDFETLQANREDIIRFLRMSYTVDVGGILDLGQKWHTEYNKEGQMAIINMLELFLRDIALHSAGVDDSYITNKDHMDVIKKFCMHLQDARIEEMIQTLEESRILLMQNIQARLLFTVIANRFTSWMRGVAPVIDQNESWKHMPASASGNQ